jgi:hypothetical protein
VNGLAGAGGAGGVGGAARAATHGVTVPPITRA